MLIRCYASAHETFFMLILNTCIRLIHGYIYIVYVRAVAIILNILLRYLRWRHSWDSARKWPDVIKLPTITLCCTVSVNQTFLSLLFMELFANLLRGDNFYSSILHSEQVIIATVSILAFGRSQTWTQVIFTSIIDVHPVQCGCVHNWRAFLWKWHQTYPCVIGITISPRIWLWSWLS